VLTGNLECKTPVMSAIMSILRLYRKHKQLLPCVLFHQMLAISSLAYTHYLNPFLIIMTTSFECDLRFDI